MCVLDWSCITGEQNSTTRALKVERMQMTLLFILIQIAWYCILSVKNDTLATGHGLQSNLAWVSCLSQPEMNIIRDARLLATS